MKKMLKKTIAYKLTGDRSNLRGDCSGLWGDCSNLRGNCSGLRGDCSGLRGDLNECVTDADRKAGLDIAMLVAPAPAGEGENDEG